MRTITAIIALLSVFSFARCGTEESPVTAVDEVESIPSATISIQEPEPPKPDTVGMPEPILADSLPPLQLAPTQYDAVKKTTGDMTGGSLEDRLKAFVELYSTEFSIAPKTDAAWDYVSETGIIMNRIEPITYKKVKQVTPRFKLTHRTFSSKEESNTSAAEWMANHDEFDSGFVWRESTGPMKSPPFFLIWTEDYMVELGTHVEDSYHDWASVYKNLCQVFAEDAKGLTLLHCYGHGTLEWVRLEDWLPEK